jgi:hypothetical protein
MQLAQNNRERVWRELERLDRMLRPFVIRQMRSMYGVFWQQEAQRSLRCQPHWTRRGHIHFDLVALLDILRDQWESIFHQRLSPAERATIAELVRVRNKLSHQNTFTDSELERVLKNVEHTLSWIGHTDSPLRATLNLASTSMKCDYPDCSNRISRRCQWCGRSYCVRHITVGGGWGNICDPCVAQRAERAAEQRDRNRIGCIVLGVVLFLMFVICILSSAH